MKRLPAKTISYLKTRFGEAVMVDVKTVKTKTGSTHFLVDVSDPEVNSHLMFDEKGNLLKGDAEPNFPEDYEEGDFYGTPEDPVV